ncbi:MAG: cation:proton antiporter [Candidatus Aenigmarchaeota archaeon]|nr:cation:proton antiporter [Candidatus Aenigmarchaeota archaeon]
MILAWYIILVAAILVIVRFLLGPTFADRMIALDVLGQIMILFFVFLAIENSAPMYLDIALTFSLLLFIGTVAVSKWIKGGRGQ